METQSDHTFTTASGTQQASDMCVSPLSPSERTSNSLCRGLSAVPHRSSRYEVCSAFLKPISAVTGVCCPALPSPSLSHALLLAGGWGMPLKEPGTIRRLGWSVWTAGHRPPHRHQLSPSLPKRLQESAPSSSADKHPLAPEPTQPGCTLLLQGGD